MNLSKLLIAISFFVEFSAIAQIDAVKIQSAKKAYDAKEYNIALESLNEVTSGGRKGKLYFYYKGLSHFELKQYDSAEVYLKKYLLLDLENVEVAGKLGDIDYEKKKMVKLNQLKNLNGKWVRVADNIESYYNIIHSENQLILKTDDQKITYQFNYNRTTKHYDGSENEMIFTGYVEASFEDMYPYTFYDGKVIKFKSGRVCRLNGYDDYKDKKQKFYAELAFNINLQTIYLKRLDIYIPDKEKYGTNELYNYCLPCKVELDYNGDKFIYTLQRK
jgi:hypothetical protein